MSDHPEQHEHPEATMAAAVHAHAGDSGRDRGGPTGPTGYDGDGPDSDGPGSDNPDGDSRGGDSGGGDSRGGPEPEAIRFFATTWVGHDGGYAARRVAVAVGSLTATVAACFVLRFAYQGLEIAEVSPFVGLLVVVMFAVCGAISFRKTWEGFTRRPADPGREESLRGLRAIGFIGSLAAYFLRSLREAPGEGLRRHEYEAALVQYERRRTARAARTAPGGNPAPRDKPPAGATQPTRPPAAPPRARNADADSG